MCYWRTRSPLSQFKHGSVDPLGYPFIRHWRAEPGSRCGAVLTMVAQGWLHHEEPTAEQVKALPGWTLLEFGSSGCGICARAQPEIQHALHEYSWIQHLKVQDGPGRRLGRSFKVKLWPTLVLLSDGLEVGRVVRPANRQEVADLLERAGGGGHDPDGDP